MAKETTICRIGNSSGLTVPKDVLERQQLAAGDRVRVIETEQGLLITPFDPGFDEAMAVYEEGARAYRNALRELA